MAVVEVSVTRASGADRSGWARIAACDRLTVHLLNAVLSVSVQVIGWELVSLGRKGGRGEGLELRLQGVGNEINLIFPRNNRFGRRSWKRGRIEDQQHIQEGAGNPWMRLCLRKEISGTWKTHLDGFRRMP